jgi:predicted helicase
MVSDCLPNEAVGGRNGQCFALYSYSKDGHSRTDNITNWALERFRKEYGDPKITKLDIFHYVYAALHHPELRGTFAKNLQRELPRVPLLKDFRAYAKAGKKLASLHLGYETLEPWKLDWIHTKGMPLSLYVEKMRLNKEKTTLAVNSSLALSNIPSEAFEYRIGNRSALEWIIDQYTLEVSKDGIISDPNREEDPEFIVRLVGQVVRVSVETVRIISDFKD